MFEELNKCVTKIKVVKKKLKIGVRKIEVAKRKIEVRYDKNQGYQEKIKQR